MYTGMWLYTCDDSKCIVSSSFRWIHQELVSFIYNCDTKTYSLLCHTMVLYFKGVVHFIGMTSPDFVLPELWHMHITPFQWQYQYLTFSQVGDQWLDKLMWCDLKVYYTLDNIHRFYFTLQYEPQWLPSALLMIL